MNNTTNPHKDGTIVKIRLKCYCQGCLAICLRQVRPDINKIYIFKTGEITHYFSHLLEEVRNENINNAV